MIKNLVTKISKNSVVSGTMYVTIGAFIGSVFSYLLQLGTARLLTVEEFGSFSSLISLASILTVPTAALTNSIIKTVAELKSQDKFAILTDLFIKISLGLVLFGIVGFVAIFLGIPFLSNYLSIHDRTLFLIFAFYFAVSFLNVPTMAYMQGLLRFRAYGFYLALAGATRLAFPLLLLILGLKIRGIFLGMILAISLMYIIGVFILKRDKTVSEKDNLRTYYKNIARFSVVTFLIGLGLSSLNNIDVILVKHYFDGHTSGIYASIVTIGKVFLFGAGTVAVIMFPQISSLYTQGKNYMNRFKNFVYLQSAFIIGGVVVLSFGPKLITRLLFGFSFDAAIEYLPLFSIFIGLYVAINFFIMFMLAINQTKVWVFLLAAVATQYFAITFFHESLKEVIYINIGVSATLLTAIIGYYCYNFRNVSFNNSTDI